MLATTRSPLQRASTAVRPSAVKWTRAAFADFHLQGESDPVTRFSSDHPLPVTRRL